MHLSSSSRSGGKPSPKTLAMTSGLRSSAESPANAIAHSVFAGPAPLQAMWNAMLARVGSSGPAAVTIKSPDTTSSMGNRALHELYVDGVLSGPSPLALPPCRGEGDSV